MDNLLNILFPQKCLLCKKAGDLLCTTCLSKCTLLHTQHCIVCDKPSINGLTHAACITPATPIQSICCFEYDCYVRECIRSAKYSSKQFMLLKILTKMASIYFKKAKLLDLQATTKWMLFPVPSSKKHLLERGFNQAHKIALELGKCFGIPVNSTCLVRTKDTDYQHGMSRRERFTNVKKAFELTALAKDIPKDVGIIIVDDIWTTGATLMSCSQVFRDAGYQNVICVTLSRKL